MKGGMLGEEVKVNGKTMRVLPRPIWKVDTKTPLPEYVKTYNTYCEEVRISECPDDQWEAAYRLLRMVKRLFTEKPERYVKTKRATTADGITVFAQDKRAVRWSLMGAISHIAYSMRDTKRGLAHRYEEHIGGHLAMLLVDRYQIMRGAPQSVGKDDVDMFGGGDTYASMMKHLGKIILMAKAGNPYKRRLPWHACDHEGYAKRTGQDTMQKVYEALYKDDARVYNKTPAEKPRARERVREKPVVRTRTRSR